MTRPSNPAADAGYSDPPPRKGFFTDTSVCIGCKACEVACKTWNAVPEDGLAFTGMSYDNSVGLGASTWRHVAFIEQPASGREPVDLGMPASRLPGAAPAGEGTAFRWLMESDVCKHCTHAACLDVCPTGALFRTEFGTVVVQADICNGCGYCVPACPYGVIERRDGPADDAAVGLAQKCTLCYDRLKDDLTPACAKACPTESIQFGDLDELRVRAQGRVEALMEAGVAGAQLYGHDPSDGVGGAGAFFLLLDRPEVYGLPPDPVVTTKDPAADVAAGDRGRRDHAGRRGGRVRHLPRRRAAMTGPPDLSASGSTRVVAGGRPGGRRGGRSGRGGRGERRMVPDAEFTSYYGRPVVRPSPWAADIPAYLFLGGLAAGSSLLGAGADLTGRPVLRRSTRIAAVAALTGSFAALVHDLGRPSRFHHMLRVAKPTSPMSVGTWILTAYGPMAGLAAAGEARRLLPARHRDGLAGSLLTGGARAGGLLAAVLAPGVVSYTGVLLGDTATPAWHDAAQQLPFVFVGSAGAAAGGLGMVAASIAEAGPARRMAVGGAAFELAAERWMESAMGLSGEQRHAGRAGRYLRAARTLTAGGGLLAAGWGRRSRPASVLAGVALLAGSALARFGTFHAGQQSARDPRYTVVPQRRRRDEGRPG